MFLFQIHWDIPDTCYPCIYKILFFPFSLCVSVSLCVSLCLSLCLSLYLSLCLYLSPSLPPSLPKIKPWDNLSLESKKFDFKIKLSHSLIWFDVWQFCETIFERCFHLGWLVIKKICSNIISSYLTLTHNGNQA